MRICLIGKYPPIQGGVSMRTYWSAHGLAARGHEVHVVTNAKEASRRFVCICATRIGSDARRPVDPAR